jgi:hypothetical protein
MIGSPMKAAMVPAPFQVRAAIVLEALRSD